MHFIHASSNFKINCGSIHNWFMFTQILPKEWLISRQEGFRNVCIYLKKTNNCSVQFGQTLKQYCIIECIAKATRWTQKIG